MHYYIIILLLPFSAVSCSGHSYPNEIPSYIQICSQSDPRLGACIRKSITALRPYLINGIPELDIPSLDPLFVPEIKIEQAGGVQIDSTFRNVEITGATNFRLRSVRADAEKDKFRMKVWFPDLMLKSDYDIQGQLLMLPIKGTGKCYGNFSDIDGVLSMKLNRIDLNGQEHFEIDIMDIEFNIGALKVNLDNLFNGEEELSRSMNIFINENWRVVTAEVRPTLEKTIADILRDVADKIFKAFPISKLFVA